MPTIDILVALCILLPGFFVAKVASALGYYKPKSNLDFVFSSLAYNYIIIIIAAILIKLFSIPLPTLQYSHSNDTVSLDIVNTILSAWQFLLILLVGSSIFGIVIAICFRFDFPLRILRKVGLTKETSFESVWTGVFYEHSGWVQVHLTDGLRIIGWVDHFSKDQDESSLFLGDACFLDSDNKQIPILGPGILITRTKESQIALIEFLDGGNGNED